VPNPAAGKTALRTFGTMTTLYAAERSIGGLV
jgi:hypothetical protein